MISAFAADTDLKKYTGTNGETETTDTLTLKDGATLSGGNGSYTSTYCYKGSDGNWYSASDIGKANSAAISTTVADLGDGFTANTTDVSTMVSGFQSVIELIIGIIAWVIVIGLPLITALDVMYITIPFVREKGEDAKASGNKAATKQGKNGETKLRWISDEAQHAVETTDLENGVSPLKTYLKSRILAFILVAIVLYLLVGGQITVVTQLAIRLVSGIMALISKL
jgi:hypothetical protein